MDVPTLKMLWLTMIIVGMAGVAPAEAVNKTSSASPKMQVSTTTTSTTTTTTTPPPPPPAQMTAVMDLFQAPLAAFKPKMEEKSDVPMGRDQQGSPVTEAPTNIFFKAGNGLGQAASSFTGWFNNRMIPQALRPKTTTAAPEVIAINQNPEIKRKIVLVAGNRRRPQRIRQRPIADDFDDEDDDTQLISYDEDNLNSYLDGYEEDYEPVERRKALKQPQKRPNRQYYYIEEELGDSEDLDYDVQIPIRKPQRKQQINNNRRRKNPPNKKQQKKKKPLRKVQNSQFVQVVQNRPQQIQIQRQKRPSTTFELVPISQNQAINSIQKKKPNSSSQDNKPQSVSQFLSIPWSRLGLPGPSTEQTSNDQQSKPIIVQIPQQNIKRKRRPMKKPAKVVSNSKPKPLRSEIQNQGPVFSILSENQIREILQNQPNQSSKPSQVSNLPVFLDTRKKENQEVPSDNDSNNNNENDMEPEHKPSKTDNESENENREENTNAYIVVGQPDDDDDKEIDVNLYRHFSNRRGFKRGRASPRISHSWLADDEYDE